MAATSLAAPASVGRDACPWALHQLSAQRNGRFRRVHPDRPCAQDGAAHPAQRVADGWAVQAVARLDACWCPGPCLELVRGCPWASGVMELVCEQAQQVPRPRGVQPRDACRAVLRIAPQQARQAGAGARVLEQQQQAREHQQAPQASLLQDPLPLWAPLSAHQARRGQQPESSESLSVQWEPRDGRSPHAPQARHRERAPQVSPGLAPPHAAWGAAALPWPPLL